MCLIYLVVVAICFSNVLANQCPNGTTTNLLKSIALDETLDTGSSDFRLHDIEFDSGTGDFFYLGHFNNDADFHFISMYNNLGVEGWSKVFPSHSVHNSLEYSATNQTLYYLTDANSDTSTSPVLMKVNSTTGAHITSHELADSSIVNNYGDCSLSGDELALFCTLYISDVASMIRLDTQASQIVSINIVTDTQDYQTQSIVAISNNETFYSFRETNSNTHHLAKAIFIEDVPTTFWLNETYHKTIAGDSTHGSVSRLSHDNATLWHAVNLGGDVTYFQLNISDLSLTGSVWSLDSPITNGGLSMEVSEEVVCILSDNPGTFLLVLNATNQDMIQVYDISTPSFIYNLLFSNGYINFAGCIDAVGTHCSHDQIPTSNGFDALPHLDSNLTYTSSVSAISLSDVAIANHDNISQTINDFSASNEADYTIQRVDDESYILSLPDNLAHNITVSPGQNYSIDLPCRVDSFSTVFNSCDFDNTTIPSWVTVDCDNIQIIIESNTGSDIVNGSFNIASIYHGGQVKTMFNITVLPCDFENCESCTDGICDVCYTGYTWNDTEAACGVIPCEDTNCEICTNRVCEACSSGYTLDDTTTCQVIPCEDANCATCTNGVCEACSTGYTWNDTTTTCEVIPCEDPNCETCTNGVCQACATGYQFDNANTTCEEIPCEDQNCGTCALGVCQACAAGYQWNDDNTTCEEIPCDNYPNCESCTNGICTTCAAGYQLNDANATCEEIPCDFDNCVSCTNGICDACSTGYELNETTAACDEVPCDYENCVSCANGICETCSEEYEWNNTTTTCEAISGEEPEPDGNSTSQSTLISTGSTFGPIYDATEFIVITQVFVSLGIFIGIASVFIAGTSLQGVWSIVHFLQLILLLPLVAISMSKNVKEFIASNAYGALAVYPLSSVKSIPLFKDLSFDQPDEYLKILGWLSGSTLVNNIVLLIILIVLAIFHSLYCLLNHKLRSEEGRLSFTSSKVYRFLTFAVYIRVFIEVCMFTALMIFSEIKYFIKYEDEDGKENGNPTSLSLSCILLIFFLFLFVLVFISWWKIKNKIEIENSWKTKELYQGIRAVSKKCLEDKENVDAPKETNQRMDVYRQESKDNEVEKEDDDVDENQEDDQKCGVPLIVKLARLYHFIFLTRRLIIAFLVVLIPSSLFALKAILIFLLQVAYLTYVILIRSFEEIKDRIAEVFSELVFLILLFFLTIYNSESKWTSTAENKYIGIILSLVLILFIVSIVSLIIELVKIIRKDKNTKKSKKEATEKQDDKEVKKGASLYAEISFSQEDQLSQRMPAIPHGSNVMLVKSTAYQEMYDEERKESQQSEDRFMN